MSSPIEIPQKKRGRRKKDSTDTTTITNTTQNTPTEEQQLIQPNNITISIEEMIESSINEPLSPVKKRGRKPKGGKLISKQQEKLNIQTPIANVILHLKCSMQDLNAHNNVISQLVSDPMVYNPSVPPSIMTYNTNDNSAFSFYNNNNSIDNNTNSTVTNNSQELNDFAYSEFSAKPTIFNNICKSCNSMIHDNENDNIEDDEDINIKDINTKLKKLKIHLYKNTNQDKKSACFWCTYEYDNPTCYIPKYEIDMQIYGYGSFCRPECAVAYLMKENIDDSTKFERYHLLNQMYSKVYDYKKNIKPAPNPYYLLDKFYGNLTIQEYRKLLKTEHMLLVIDKPLTRILPELHEDNEEFIHNIYGSKNTNTSQGGVYKVKRESEKQKGQSKTSIMKERFGLSASS
jgi:hypothetical protein